MSDDKGGALPLGTSSRRYLECCAATISLVVKEVEQFFLLNYC